MGIIHLLDSITANSIAAGEVVERPASVVKEMAENAIDAGAQRISILTEGGGLERIQVSDDGRGMVAEDALMAFERHATSKLRSISDLDQLHSMGFRGEALAAISAVSKLTLQTRSAGQAGCRIYIEGGELLEQLPCDCPVGSTFLVEDLFFNTPARRKFLRSERSESARIYDVVQALALAHPQLQFVVQQNGKESLRSPGNGRMEDLIYALFGRKTLESSYFASWEQRELEAGLERIEVVLGHPSLARKSRSHEHFFVNGRSIQSGLLAKAVEEAYRSFLMKGQYPFVVLKLEIPPHLLDVNVHPQKTELRFAEERKVFVQVLRRLRQELERCLAQSIAQVPEPQGGPREAVGQGPESAKEEAETLQGRLTEAARERQETGQQNFAGAPISRLLPPTRSGYSAKDSYYRWNQLRYSPSTDQPDLGQIAETGRNYIAQPELSAASVEEAPTGREEASAEEGRVSDQGLSLLPESQSGADQSPAEPQIQGRSPELEDCFAGEFVTVVFDTYLLIRGRKAIYWVDQHAAHERILYEEILEAYAQAEVPRQVLLEGLMLELPPQQVALAEQQREFFAKLGFIYDILSARELVLRELPALDQRNDEAQLFQAMLDELHEDGGAVALDGRREELRLRFATRACKAAIKAHDRISSAEARELMRRLARCSQPFQCPHGRPSVLRMEARDFEKLFKRSV